jgi:DNA-binding LacI/PurR family transcriptional regulator
VPRHAGWFRERFMDGFAAGFGARVPADALVELDSAEASTSACVERVADLQVDGVIGVGSNYGWPLYALHRLGLPVLADLVSAEWPAMPVTSVNFSATSEAAGVMLRRHGHRSACIVGTWHAGANRAGFARGLAREDAVLTADVHSPEATQQLRALLHTHRPTALYVPDNSALPSVLTMLAGEGLRIPQDMSLVMHDGNTEPYDGFTLPRIASVGPSIQEIGKALAERMCRILGDTPADEAALQYLQPVVRVSGSVRRV